MAAIKKTARESVLEKYLTAFAHDDGEWICIRIQTTEEVVCSECRRKYTRNKAPDFCIAIGSAGNEEAAWKDAAQKL